MRCGDDEICGLALRLAVKRPIEGGLGVFVAGITAAVRGGRGGFAGGVVRDFVG